MELKELKKEIKKEIKKEVKLAIKGESKEVVDKLTGSITKLKKRVAVVEDNFIQFERELPDVVSYLHDKYEGKGISPKTLGRMAKTMMQFKHAPKETQLEN